MRIPLAVALLVAPLTAAAHPFEDGSLGHLVRLTVYEDAVTVAFRVEVPTKRVMGEIRDRERAGATDRGEGFTREKLIEMEAGLYIEIDGERAEMSTVPVEENGLGNARFFLFDVVLSAPLDPGPHEIRVTNGNYPDEAGYFSNLVEVSDRLEVTACSLLDIESGEVTADRTERWSRGADGREVSVRVAPRGAWASGTGEIVPAARAVGGGVAWLPWLAGGAALAGVSALAAFAWRRR